MRILLFPFRFILWIFRVIGRWFANIGRDFREFFSEEPEDAPLPDAFAKVVESPTGVLVHLDALRKHLIRAVLFLAFTTALSFAIYPQLISFLALPLEGGIENLVAIEPTEPISTVMRVSLLSGFALAFPYIALELWLFIGPGVSRRARFIGLATIPIATLFFVGGMAFAYYVMLPQALRFLLNVAGFETQLTPSSYVRFTTNVIFWIGLVFEFPLVIFFLASINLIQARALAQQWRLAIVIIAVIAAMITPTVDPVSMTIVMAPLIVLFFLSVGLAFIAQRRRPAQSQAEPG